MDQQKVRSVAGKKKRIMPDNSDKEGYYHHMVWLSFLKE